LCSRASDFLEPFLQRFAVSGYGLTPRKAASFNDVGMMEFVAGGLAAALRYTHASYRRHIADGKAELARRSNQFSTSAATQNDWATAGGNGSGITTIDCAFCGSQMNLKNIDLPLSEQDISENSILVSSAW
jgi:hypothetical protein